MDHTEVLKRAWHTVWNYRALWIFGTVLALVTFSWGTAVVLDGADDLDADDWEEQGIVVTRLPGETFREALQRTIRKEVQESNRALSELFEEELGITVKANVLVIAAVLTAVAFLAWVVAKIARYVSETALIRNPHGRRIPRDGRAFEYAAGDTPGLVAQRMAAVPDQPARVRHGGTGWGPAVRPDPRPASPLGRWE